MRNATVKALIYEFLFDVYRLMEHERPRAVWLPDENGVLHEPFSHDFTSCWEWSTSVLEEVGALRSLESPYSPKSENKLRRAVESPFYYPVMSLDECRSADFSEFETFDNYCYAMFTYVERWGDDVVDPAWMSPQFTNSIATQDDIFSLDPSDWPIFGRDRFEEKVMTRWEEMEVRVFRRKDSA